jgi:imidazolonepropionase
MLIHSASQLLTLAGGPQRGHELGRLGIIADGAVLIRDEKIAAVGSTEELRNAYPQEPLLDAAGHVVMPGLVDPHTHAIWVGDRLDEFEQLAQGVPYSEMIARGGGVYATMRDTCSASLETLIEQTRPRLVNMFSSGTTTAEVRTGYGQRISTGLRMFQALLALDREGPLELAFTFLGSHAIHPNYRQRSNEYADLVCTDMLGMLKAWWTHHAPYRDLPFVDVALGREAFRLDEAERIMNTAREQGFPLKVLAADSSSPGSVGLAVEKEATSVDHLAGIALQEIRSLANCETVAVLLPATIFGLGAADYAPAQVLLEAGGLLALASDLNPETTWCESMQFVIALACRYLHLTPAQAIAAATINAAAAIRRADKIGSLEPGKQADLLILSVSDYRHLGYRFGTNLAQTVIKKGRVYPV